MSVCKCAGLPGCEHPPQCCPSASPALGTSKPVGYSPLASVCMSGQGGDVPYLKSTVSQDTFLTLAVNRQTYHMLGGIPDM